MGALISSLLNSIFGNREARVLILGLDNAGKTTILYKLHIGEVVTTIPTIGFNVETILHNKTKFQVWDLGGQTSIRPYWRCYYANTDAIVFVVDSTDAERFAVAKQELHAMLEEDELKNVVLCVFANKQDLPTAMTPSQISDALNLSAIKDRQWAILKTSAVKGEGIYEGLDWLCNAVKNNR